MYQEYIASEVLKSISIDKILDRGIRSRSVM